MGVLPTEAVLAVAEELNAAAALTAVVIPALTGSSGTLYALTDETGTTERDAGTAGTAGLCDGQESSVGRWATEAEKTGISDGM